MSQQEKAPESASAPEQMTAVVAEETGGPEVLRPRTRPTPQPGPGQVLVRTEATGVNFIETYQRSGVYPVDLPFVPGTEAVGVIEATGPDVDLDGLGLRVGARAATCQASGTYAERFLVDAQKLVAVPEHLDTRTAACLPLQGITAQYLSRSAVPVRPDQTAVVLAGAGGVGGLLIQLLKHICAEVIATASTEQKREIAREHGADHVLSYEGFDERVRELTDGRGADVVYDSVGKDTFDQSLQALRPRGTAVLYGGASGQVPPFDLQRLNALGSLYVTRPSTGAYLQDREELQARLGEVFELAEAGVLRPTLDTAFPLAEAADAHRHLEARRSRGKVLLIP